MQGKRNYWIKFLLFKQNLSRLKEDLSILTDEEFKARMTKESNVTFSLFQEVCTLAFKDSRSKNYII